MTGAFRAALAFVLSWEGGYVDHPDDPGGATNQGITQATYDAWRASQGLAERSVKALTEDERDTIYWGRYWQGAGCELLDAPEALVAFDAAVHSGVGMALRWHAEASGDWRVAIARRLTFLVGLTTWPSFGRGWARRIASLLRTAAALEAETGAPEERQRKLVVLDEENLERFVTVLESDVLIRVGPDRVYVRVTPTE